MADVFAKSGALHSLLQWLAEQPDWPLKDRLALVQRLARQVQTLHQNGRIHRAISIDAVTVDERLQPQMPPPAGVRRFGGEDSDPGVLSAGTDRRTGSGPARTDRFRREETRRGRLSARPAADQRLSVGRAPLPTRNGRAGFVVYLRPHDQGPGSGNAQGRCWNGALGFDSPERFENCDGLIAALDEALRRTERARSAHLRAAKRRPRAASFASAATRRRRARRERSPTARGRRASLRAVGTLPHRRADRQRRDGRRLSRLRRIARPAGGRQGASGRNWPATPISSAAFMPKPRRQPASPIPTSCRSISSAKTPGTTFSPCSTSRGSRWPSGLAGRGGSPSTSALELIGAVPGRFAGRPRPRADPSRRQAGQHPPGSPQRAGDVGRLRPGPPDQ